MRNLVVLVLSCWLLACVEPPSESTETSDVTDDFSIAVSPTSTSVAAGTSTSITVSTAVVSGSPGPISFSLSGLPAGTTASFSPASVAAGGSSTLTITAASTAPSVTGAVVSVTGSDATGTHSASFTLSVAGTGTTNDFSIAVSPTSATVPDGGTVTVHVTTAVSSGSPGTIALSASGLPSGVTVAFNPSSVTAGSSSTLTVTATSSAPLTTALIAITGASSSNTHAATLTLTVGPASTVGALTNGGFETGSLWPWTVTGYASPSSTAHTGSYSAMVGSASPSADSSLAQTFMAPTGASQLSFWYRIVCPDTLTYDWASATLRDNTAGTTVTMLAPTCTNDATWRLATATVIAGHSYTLTLKNHDDEYPGDATYTLYDDVAFGAWDGIVNGGFESGLSGWTATGTASTTTSSPHGGAAAALLGSTSPSNTSTLSQTFTAPAGSSILSLWYRITCPDTLTFDWAMVTLHDVTTGTTTTVLPDTCALSSTYYEAATSIIPGHTYTLTLTNHDDDYPGDATYTEFDDVGLY